VREKLDDALAGMREQAQQEAARQRHRLAKLTAERGKLLHAYYAGAVPLDLLKQEQDRLTGEIAWAERHLETVEQPSAKSRRRSTRPLLSWPTASAATPGRPAICVASGTRRCSSGCLSTTTASRRPRSPSRFRHAHRPGVGPATRRRRDKRNRRFVWWRFK